MHPLRCPTTGTYRTKPPASDDDAEMFPELAGKDSLSDSQFRRIAKRYGLSVDEFMQQAGWRKEGKGNTAAYHPDF